MRKKKISSADSDLNQTALYINSTVTLHLNVLNCVPKIMRKIYEYYKMALKSRQPAEEGLETKMLTECSSKYIDGFQRVC